MHIAYLYGQNGSLELEWIRTTLEKECWTSRLNRKYLTVETRMSPLWELNYFMLQQLLPYQFLRKIWCTPHLRGLMRCQADWVKSYGPAELFLNSSLWKQTLSQVILVIASYWWSKVRYCKEVFVRETSKFPHANEKGALKTGNKNQVKV